MKTITRNKRSYLADNLVVHTWQDIATYYDELSSRTIENKDELLKWMHDRSETDAVLDEEYRWRYIRQTCDTENEIDKKAYEDFIQMIMPNWMTFANQLNKKLAENPYINELEWLQSIGAENKQGNITADEARNILKGLSLTAFESGYKIQIIWMAEALSKEGNILLKLLEEPPENTVLILIAEIQEEILPTILSRCQLVKINKIDDASMAQALLKKGVPQSNTQHIAYLADGNFNAALSLMDSETHENTKLLTQWLDFSINLKAGELLKWTDEAGKMGRENLKSFLEYSTHIFREALMLLHIKNYAPRLAQDELNLAVRINKFLTYQKLEKLLELINKKHYEIERNVSPKMVLMDMSLRMNKIIRSKD